MQPYNQKLIINSRTLRSGMTDAERDAALTGLGLRVLRFDNRQVLTEIEGVMVVIDGAVGEISGQREA
jgi:very-short-patch-repair endonuclease